VAEPSHNRPVLKGALHTHTTHSDGDLTPEELLQVYRDLDFDFVALTDHDFIMVPDTQPVVPEMFEEMLVFQGVEKTVFARGYLHIGHIHGDTEELNILFHPAQFGFTPQQIMERIDALHESIPIHAVEVTMKGFYTPEYDTDEIPLPKIASDDAHTRDSCGRAWVEVSCERDKDTILRAIKSGQARVCTTWTANRSAWTEYGGTHRG
jgi:hypothetical protein